MLNSKLLVPINGDYNSGINFSSIWNLFQDCHNYTFEVLERIKCKILSVLRVLESSLLEIFSAMSNIFFHLNLAEVLQLNPATSLLHS